MRPFRSPYALVLVIALCEACSLDRDLASRAMDGAVDGRATPSDADTIRDGVAQDGPEPTPRDGGDDPSDWSDPEPVPGVSDPIGCETDPVLTGDLGLLFLSRPALPGGDCRGDRSFFVFQWNGGAPTLLGALGRFDGEVTSESNAHPVDGALAGRPGEILFVHTAEGGDLANRDLRVIWLSASNPLAPPGAWTSLDSLNTETEAESSPTLTNDGATILFGRGDDIWQSTGAPPTFYPMPRALGLTPAIDPAISTDGRLLVFERGGDLFIARRAGVEAPFDSPVPLPSGPTRINTMWDESDPFIASNGDLLFTSTRGDGATSRVFRARAAWP